MKLADYSQWVARSVWSARSRTTLTALGMAIGIAAVTLLTSIGEGLRLYLLEQFSQFGTHIVAVTPGKTSTQGMAGMLSTVRPLTIDDAEALRALPYVKYVVPIVSGTGRAQANRRARNTNVIGAGAEGALGWKMTVAQGSFLPRDDPTRPRPYAVLGAKLKTELFGNGNPLGELIKVNHNRFRVVGVMESKGQFLGFDLDDALYIPAAKALQLFNRESLMEVDIIYSPATTSKAMAEQIRQTLIQRHGEEDFTLFTQDDMLKSLDKILGVLKIAIGALGSVSLLVGGVGVFTIMTTALQERTAEIGLLRAIGTTRHQVIWLFLGESILLALLGGGLGIAVILLLFGLLSVFAPSLPLSLQPAYLMGAMTLSALIGLLAGAAPAWRASQLDPVIALRAE